eukprot:TRINITY_DN25496_c0_g1_i1.p1 TRINITY_DN25496_c0_g1~~TRINITY_DN25496_c0_g1_i1.p1  ORF type:complete len:502 (+),score=66.16 TRINITY_DN25496_c0_g1_i1:83-1588(+)
MTRLTLTGLVTLIFLAWPQQPAQLFIGPGSPRASRSVHRLHFGSRSRSFGRLRAAGNETASIDSASVTADTAVAAVDSPPAEVEEASPTVAATASADDWRRPKEPDRDTSYKLWPALPVAPYERRKTVRIEQIPGEVWAFEQKLGLLYVHVPIRMTAVRLAEGGLLLYGALAPTRECLSLIKELEAQYGEVRYLVLGSVAVEHKTFAAPLANALPSAKVFVAPGQYAVPIPLPLALLGFPMSRTRVLDTTRDDWPWGSELEFKVLGPIGKDINTGAFCEAVFFVPRLKLLLVTDLLVKLPTEIPEIIREDPRALVYHGRDGPLSEPRTDEATLMEGWQKICMFSLFFVSDAINVQPLGEALEAAQKTKVPELGWGGLLPWTYKATWKETYDAVADGVFVVPVLSELVLKRGEKDTNTLRTFYEAVAEWPFDKFLAQHFAGVTPVTPTEWKNAYRRFLDDPVLPIPCAKPRDEDLQYLRNASRDLEGTGLLDPQLPKRQSLF